MKLYDVFGWELESSLPVIRGKSSMEYTDKGVISIIVGGRSVAWDARYVALDTKVNERWLKDHNDSYREALDIFKKDTARIDCSLQAWFLKELTATVKGE